MTSWPRSFLRHDDNVNEYSPASGMMYSANSSFWQEYCTLSKTMKASRTIHKSSSIWITLTGVVLALLICVLATSMVGIIYPQSNTLFDHILSKSGEAIALDGLAIFSSQPTPFQPGPTQTAMPTQSPTAVPTKQPESRPQPVNVVAVVPENDSNTDEQSEVYVEIPMSASIGSLKGSPQLYTLDCEAQAAVDWASFFGVSIDELDFIDNMPRSDDPETGFVGDINGAMGQLPPNSYGIHAAPIADMLQDYGIPAIAKKNWTFSGIKQEIAAGNPVIAWIVNLPFDIDSENYTASNGNTSKVARFEHTWIIIGYNASTVTVVDSNWTYNVKISEFMDRWEALDKQVVIYNGD